MLEYLTKVATRAVRNAIDDAALSINEKRTQTEMDKFLNSVLGRNPPQARCACGKFRKRGQIFCTH